MNIDRQHELSDSNDPNNPDNWDLGVVGSDPVNIKVYEIPEQNKLAMIVFNVDNDFEYYTTDILPIEAASWFDEIVLNYLTIEDVSTFKSSGKWRTECKNIRLIADSTEAEEVLFPETKVGYEFLHRITEG